MVRCHKSTWKQGIAWFSKIDFQKVWLLPVIRDVFRNVDDCDILKHDSEPKYFQSWRDLIVHLVSKDLDGINVVLPVDFRFKELPP